MLLEAHIPINISDCSDFDIIDLGEGKGNLAIRLTMEDEIERYNDEVMELTDESFKQIIQSVPKRSGKFTPRAYTANVQTQEQTRRSSKSTHGASPTK